MRSLLIIIFVLSSASFLPAQEKIKSDTVNQKVHGKKEGYWIKHRKNGQILWEGYYKEGDKTGLWRFYDENGKGYSEGKLINGYRIGEWYDIDVETKTKLDMTKWDGKGHCVGGATLSW